MKKSMKKVIPVTAVTLGIMTGGTVAFANQDGTPTSDLPSQVEAPEVQSVPVQESPQQEAETPVEAEKPKPEPSFKQMEIGGQSEEKPKTEVEPKEKPSQETPKQVRQNPASETVSSQQAPSASASRIEGRVNVATNHASTKSTVEVAEEKKVVASDSKQGEEEEGIDSDSDMSENEKIDAERTPKTESGGKMPKTAAPGPLAALVGAGLMAGGAVVKRFRFRRG